MGHSCAPLPVLLLADYVAMIGATCLVVFFSMSPSRAAPASVSALSDSSTDSRSDAQGFAASEVGRDGQDALSLHGHISHAVAGSCESNRTFERDSVQLVDVGEFISDVTRPIASPEPMPAFSARPQALACAKRARRFSMAAVFLGRESLRSHAAP